MGANCSSGSSSQSCRKSPCCTLGRKPEEPAKELSFSAPEETVSPDMEPEPTKAEQVMLSPAEQLRRLNAELRLHLHDGVPFMKNEPDLLKSEVKEKGQLEALAEVLIDRPTCAILISGYAEKPEGRWKAPGLSKALSAQRARSLREMLQAQGCTNFMACQGLGYQDDLGGRCTIQGIDRKEADRIEEKHLCVSQDPLGEAQRQIDACLVEAGITFDPGFARITPEGKQVVSNISEVLHEFPELGYRISCYTSRPGHSLTPTQEVCQALSDKRCHLIKDLLRENGCCSRLELHGLGHVDEKGARVVVEAVEPKELGEHDIFQAEQCELSKTARSEMAVGRGGLEIVFATKTEDTKVVTFWRAPLGMVMSRTLPYSVAEVKEGSHAAEMGTRKGWEVRMIGCKSVTNMRVKAADELLSHAVAALPKSS